MSQYLHIGGGGVGLLAGTAAVVTRKGSWWHRWADKHSTHHAAPGADVMFSEPKKR